MDVIKLRLKYYRAEMNSVPAKKNKTNLMAQQGFSLLASLHKYWLANHVIKFRKYSKYTWAVNISECKIYISVTARKGFIIIVMRASQAKESFETNRLK